jgi:hypothetical protein
MHLYRKGSRWAVPFWLPAEPKLLVAIESQYQRAARDFPMNAIIYLVGLVVIILAILSWLGLS